MPTIDPAWIALIGTLCGGLGLKIVEHWLGRNKTKTDEASKLRDELRVQIDDLKEEIKGLEAERDKYRNDWLDLRDKYVAQTTQLTLALRDIEHKSQDAAKLADDVDKQLPPHN